MKAALPCASCPWRRENQTPAAIEASPVDGRGIHWFALSNLRNRWRHVARGGILPCHVTDKRAPLYGGKFTAAKEGRTCIGISILAQREVLHFMRCGMDPARYAKTPGIRFSLKGLAMWASMLLHAGATIQAGESVLAITKGDDPGDGICVPWPDSISVEDA